MNKLHKDERITFEWLCYWMALLCSITEYRSIMSVISSGSVHRCELCRDTKLANINIISEHVIVQIMSACTDLAVPLLHYLPHFPFWEAQQEFYQPLCFAFTLTDKNHYESGDFHDGRKYRKWLWLLIVLTEDGWDFTQTREISLDIGFKAPNRFLYLCGCRQQAVHLSIILIWFSHSNLGTLWCQW